MLEHTLRLDPLSLGDIRESSSAVHIAVTRLKRLMDQEIAHTLDRLGGIKLAEWRILYVLADGGAMPQKDVVRRIMMEQSHASRALKSMQAAGLVSMTRDEDDLRRWNFTLTRKGRALFRKLEPEMKARRDYLDGILSNAEIELFKDIATRVAQRTLQSMKDG